MNNKTIYLLIGQKGSGKSYIGGILEKEFGISFIHVEDWAKHIKKERPIDNEVYLKQVFAEIEKGIRDCLDEKDNIVFESTGLTDYFDQMLHNLKKDFQVKTIGVYADSKTCLDRVKSRDQRIHINISDDQVSTINEKVRERDFQTDYRVINEAIAENELLQELEKIIELTNT